MSSHFLKIFFSWKIYNHVIPNTFKLSETVGKLKGDQHAQTAWEGRAAFTHCPRRKTEQYILAAETGKADNKANKKESFLQGQQTPDVRKASVSLSLFWSTSELACWIICVVLFQGAESLRELQGQRQKFIDKNDRKVH